MAREEAIQMEGIVVEALPGTQFLVEILPPTISQDENTEGEQPEEVETKQKFQSENKMTVRASIAGRMRVNYIKISPGDRVTVEVSPYDMTKGRITYRHK